MQHQLSGAIGEMHVQSSGVKATHCSRITSKQPLKGLHRVQTSVEVALVGHHAHAQTLLLTATRSNLRYAVTSRASKQNEGTVQASKATLVNSICLLIPLDSPSC